jgi:hypothetical protein
MIGNRVLNIIMDIGLDPITYRTRINTTNRDLSSGIDIVLGIAPNIDSCNRLDQSTKQRSHRAGERNTIKADTITHENKQGN